MGEQTKNMLIGLFVIVACFLVISMVFFLRPEVGDGRQKVYARFANINKIDIGTRVMFAGKPVGEVVAIEEIHDARQMPSTDLLGRVYFYQLTLRIDSQVKVYDTDEMSIQTSGLLGEKSIAITPKSPPKGVVPTLVTTQPVYAESADPIENAFLELSDLANDMQATVKDAHRWIQKHGEELGVAVRSFSEIAQGLAKGEGTLGRLLERDDFYLKMNAVMSKCDALMNDVNHYGLLFHLNKSWQRQRLQRAAALNGLNTPESFQNYFATEIEQINMAMSRLKMLIEKAEVTSEREQIFADMLRQANDLSENLRLYNQILMEQN